MGVLHPSTRELKSEAQRRKILDAAVALFQQYGINAVGVRDITETAGVSTGTFYHYFESKQHVINQVYSQVKPDFPLILGEAAQQPSAREALFRFLTEFLPRQILHDGLEFTTHRVFVIRKHSPKRSDLYRGCLKLVQLAQEKGEFTPEPDAEAILDYLLMVQRAVVNEWCLAEGSLDLFKATAEAVEYAMRAFIPR